MAKNKYTEFSDLDAVVLKTLKKIRKSLIKGSYLVDNSRNIERISTAIELLGRYSADYYDDELRLFVKVDHKFIKDEEGDFYRLERTLIKNNLNYYFSLHGNKFKKFSTHDLGDENHDYIVALRICEELKNQSRNISYSIIQRYGTGWWV